MRFNFLVNIYIIIKVIILKKKILFIIIFVYPINKFNDIIISLDKNFEDKLSKELNIFDNSLFII